MNYSPFYLLKLKIAFELKQTLFIEQIFFPEPVSRYVSEVYAWNDFSDFVVGRSDAFPAVLWRVKWKNLQKTDFVK